MVLEGRHSCNHILSVVVLNVAVIVELFLLNLFLQTHVSSANGDTVRAERTKAVLVEWLLLVWIEFCLYRCSRCAYPMWRIKNGIMSKEVHNEAVVLRCLWMLAHFSEICV